LSLSLLHGAICPSITAVKQTQAELGPVVPLDFLSPKLTCITRATFFSGNLTRTIVPGIDHKHRRDLVRLYQDDNLDILCGWTILDHFLVFIFPVVI